MYNFHFLCFSKKIMPFVLSEVTCRCPFPTFCPVTRPKAESNGWIVEWFLKVRNGHPRVTETLLLLTMFIKKSVIISKFVVPIDGIQVSGK